MSSFSPSAASALEFARLISSELGHTYIGTEHLLLALLSESEGNVKRIFSHFKITYADMLSRIISLFGKGERTHPDSSDITPRLKRVIERSSAFAEEYSSTLSSEHLAVALLSERDAVGLKLIEETGVKGTKILTLFMSTLENEERIKNAHSSHKNRREHFAEMKKETPVLNKFSRDLVEEAFRGRGAVLVGREEEIDRVIRVLMRRGKNNPCLIGEPGVGKTAIAEGLAKRIAQGEVPSPLLDFRIVSLDISSVVAGAKYRGDFEERIRAITDEVVKSERVILMIDEIHNIVGAGSAEGAIDAANILKPALARDEVRIIGATTLREYKKYIEKDAALERRFQPIEIKEPTPEQALEILRGIKKGYEEFHGVEIDDEALKKAVTLSVRYNPERFLPDKAIDLVDEVCAKKKIEKKKEVRGEDIAEAVSEMSGIPLGKITGEEKGSLQTLSKKLRERVIGQEKAIDELVNSHIRSRLGVSNPNRPRGAYLFVGPTGVGKTSLARAFAEEIFERDAFLKLDMSEYSEKHSVSKLVGAPPGYVGYDEAGVFDKLRRRPFSVVVFDEIEKAHADVLNLLLQILDEGKITDSQGRKIDFKNTVVILTSNLGSERFSSSRVGFSEKSGETLGRERTYERVREVLPAELISRLDTVLYFSPLGKNDYEEIAKGLINTLVKRCEGEGIELVVEDGVVLRIVEKSDKKAGARGVERAVREELENRVSRILVEGDGDKTRLVARVGENGEILIFAEEKATLF